ncbi:glutaredoxin family protein [Terribacillus sp. DMT04]|uniref:glutaredoxin family protein n=1 Tax=Terribacillus sp. DMT04 TaxID=2850441 RepID=UPI001C2C4161|nr:glutaredoxin family protein [Terribacillus sp. DMT04]QXE02221.1 glutaredoxin family protein [Terribacillus sp. DMT04]
MKHRRVDVYISDHCRQCDKVVQQLDEWNISYNVKNVTDSPALLKEMQAYSIYSTPLVLVNGEKVHGFQKDRLQQVLGLINRMRSTRTQISY